MTTAIVEITARFPHRESRDLHTTDANVKPNDANASSGETSEEVSHLSRRRRKVFAGIRSSRNEGQNVQVSARKVEGLSARPEMRFQDEPLSSATAVNFDVKKVLAEACPEFFASLPDKKY